MRSLVLLYRDGKDIVIREYENIKEEGRHYVFEEGRFGKEGIGKQYVGKICKYDFSMGATCEGRRISTYPVSLPYVGYGSWNGTFFMFVNKKKYDENPSFYLSIIRNYRE